MRRGRTLIFLILIVVVIGIAAFTLLPAILRSVTATPAPVTIQVYYATQTFRPGDVITEDRLGTRPLPQDAVAEDYFKVDERDQLIGLIAKVVIDQGVIISTGLVAPPGSTTDIGGPQWASVIPATKNAIAIPISRLTSVAYGVADGAHINLTACMLMVDVDPSFQTQLPNATGTVLGPTGAKLDDMPGISLSIVPPGDGSSLQGRTEVEPAFQLGIYVVPSEPQRPRLVCQMILQDVMVLKLGNFSLQPGLSASNQAPPTPLPSDGTQTAVPSPDIITLIVSPQEAVVLTYMVYANIPMYLTLRNPTDPARQVTESATLQFLLSQFNIPVPVKLAYALTPRLDFLSLPFLPNDVVTVPAQ